MKKEIFPKIILILFLIKLIKYSYFHFHVLYSFHFPLLNCSYSEGLLEGLTAKQRTLLVSLNKSFVRDGSRLVLNPPYFKSRKNRVTNPHLGRPLNTSN